MGTLAPVDDLRVTLLRSTTVLPSEPTKRRSFFLSNIDQVLNFDVDTVHFFGSNPGFPPPSVAEKLEHALARVLVSYDFLAGRLRLTPSDARLEIDCNGAGVAFSVASSELTLEEIGDLVYPNPAFRELIYATPRRNLAFENRPMISFQVTSFKCGSFSIGVSSNHATLDGISFKIFLDNLAAVSAGKPLAAVPCHDRHLLAARSPPRVVFPHPELQPLLQGLPGAVEPPATLLDPTTADLEFKLFHLSGDDIALLKEKAKGGCDGAAITGFNVVTAHIWRCKVLATAAAGTSPDKTSTVLYAVDLRPRMRPPLPKSYTGNAVLTGYGAVSLREIEEAPFSRLVEAVRKGAERMSDEYARSVIDWGELHKGVPQGDVFVSSWWRLGYNLTEYPWGRPIYCVPVLIPNGDIVVLLPEKATDAATQGVNALVGLPTKKMGKFETLFRALLY